MSQPDDLTGELLKKAAGELISAGVKEAVSGAIAPGAGLLFSKALSFFRTAGRGQAEHPSLQEVRNVLDALERMIPSGNGRRSAAPFTLPARSVFERADKTGRQVADLWFQRRTAMFRAGPGPFIDIWVKKAPLVAEPYFTAQGRLLVDFEKAPRNRRHPLLRQLHPFIMLTRFPVEPSDDAVTATMREFEAIWRAFVDSGSMEFVRGIEMRLDRQGYIAGAFRVRGYAFETAGGRLMPEETDISIWREMFVSLVGNTLWVLNYGTPRYEGAEDMEPHFRSWMSGFRVNRF